MTPENVDVIDSSSFIGMSLYAYCGNNPVNYMQSPVSSGDSNATSSNVEDNSTNFRTRASSSASSGIEPWYVPTIVGVIPSLVTFGRYLRSNGMHKYFVYKKNYYYMFPILGATHKRLAINSSNFGKISNATFRELVTGNAKASLGSIVGNIAGAGAAIFFTSLGLNLFENGFNFDDKAMWIDTGIDTAIGIAAYGLSIGTAALVTAGLSMAGVALPGVIVIGGVAILSIGFEHIIREIAGYWE